MGDFNIDMLKNKSSDFPDMLASCGLSPMITKPTRISNKSVSLIDNIFTNAMLFKSTNITSSELLITDLSDHFPIVLRSSFSVKSTKSQTRLQRNFCKRNISRFVHQISETGWQHVYDENDTNSSYNKFITTFSGMYDECFPVGEQPNRRRTAKTSQ